MDGKNEIVAVEARISENSEIFSRGTDTSKEVLSTFSQKIMFDDIRMSTLEQWIAQQVARFIDGETICVRSRSLAFIKPTK